MDEFKGGQPNESAAGNGAVQTTGESEPCTVLQDPLVGKMFAQKYRILAKLGAGGMSVVYKANDIGLNRIVALKLLSRDRTWDSGALLRFQMEARAASQLNNPHIMRIHEFTVPADGHPFIVMDYISGVTLAELLDQSGPLELHRWIELFLQVCEGLMHAHEKAVIHRDLKPSNLLITKTPRGADFVTIVDFGIAKVLNDESHLTKAGEIFGSPSYMSPEQCRGGQIIDYRSDIYSLGCLMYEAIAGRVPFQGKGALQIFCKHIYELPSPLAVACPGRVVPEAVEQIVMKALEKEPENRYQSVSEVEEALVGVQRWLQEEMSEGFCNSAERDGGNQAVSTAGMQPSLEETELTLSLPNSAQSPEAEMAGTSSGSLIDTQSTPGSYSAQESLTQLSGQTRTFWIRRGRLAAMITAALICCGSALFLAACTDSGSVRAAKIITGMGGFTATEWANFFARNRKPVAAAMLFGFAADSLLEKQQTLPGESYLCDSISQADQYCQLRTVANAAQHRDAVQETVNHIAEVVSAAGGSHQAIVSSLNKLSIQWQHTHEYKLSELASSLSMAIVLRSERIDEPTVLSSIDALKAGYILSGSYDELSATFAALSERFQQRFHNPTAASGACLYAQALASSKRKDYAKADQLYNSAVSVLEKSGADKGRIALAYYEQGRNYAAWRHIPQSQACYEKALQLSGQTRDSELAGNIEQALTEIGAIGYRVDARGGSDAVPVVVPPASSEHGTKNLSARHTTVANAANSRVRNTHYRPSRKSMMRKLFDGLRRLRSLAD